MSAAEIDTYLDELDEPKRSTLSQLRRDILAAVPDAEQCISYAVPGFKVAGKTIAGFAAFTGFAAFKSCSTAPSAPPVGPSRGAAVRAGILHVRLVLGAELQGQREVGSGQLLDLGQLLRTLGVRHRPVSGLERPVGRPEDVAARSGKGLLATCQRRAEAEVG
jgi:hypothetical protein